MIKPSFTLQTIKEKFREETAVLHPVISTQRCAAVALIFNEDETNLQLCLGLRATYEGDPWSGDMAFPGGKAELEDKTFHHIAQRETFEETGLIVGRENLVGSLEPIQTFGNEKRPSLLIRPMIYAIEDKPSTFHLNSELAAAYWIPTTHLWHSKNWIQQHVEWRGQYFPGIQFQQHVIWGLTLRVLYMFSEKIGHPFK